MTRQKMPKTGLLGRRRRTPQRLARQEYELVPVKHPAMETEHYGEVLLKGLDPRVDREVSRIARTHGGKSLGAGFFFVTGERDMSFKFKNTRAVDEFYDDVVRSTVLAPVLVDVRGKTTTHTRFMVRRKRRQPHGKKV